MTASYTLGSGLIILLSADGIYEVTQGLSGKHLRVAAAGFFWHSQWIPWCHTTVSEHWKLITTLTALDLHITSVFWHYWLEGHPVCKKFCNSNPQRFFAGSYLGNWSNLELSVENWPVK